MTTEKNLGSTDQESGIYEDEELNFLSAEFLRDKLDDTLETVPEYREQCIKTISRGSEVRTISFQIGWEQFDVTRGKMGPSKSLQIVKTTPKSKTVVIISSNEETKNGMFTYNRELLNQKAQHFPEENTPVNDRLTFYTIFSESESLGDLAYPKK